MSDLLRPVEGKRFEVRWSTTLPSVTLGQPLPVESVTLGTPLLENLQRTRTATGPPALPSTQISVRIPASMIGGIGGYVISLVSGQTVTTPPVRDAEVVPQGEQAVLKLSVEGQVSPDSQLMLTSGTATGQFVPTMLAVEPGPIAPEPQRPQIAHLEPLSPAALHPPEDVLQALRASKRVLVVCHTPPDGDTAGSGLGMRRLLQSLGKQADLFLDGPLPGWMRHQAEPGEFKSWDEVRAGGYDTVVVVDVAQGYRCGRARELIEQAPKVVVLDHHDDQPTPASLGRTGPVFSWVAPVDATALLVGAVAEKLQPPSWEGLTEPLVTGVLTDTELFRKPVRPETGPMLKHLLEVRGDGNLEQACRRVEASVSEEAQGLLMEPLRFKGELLRPEAEGLRQAALAQGAAYHEELEPELAVMLVPRETQKLATEAGKLSDPETNKADLQDIFYARLNQLAQEKPLAVMLWEHPDHVHVSIRTQDPERAARLAHTLDGGGKPGQAAAHPRLPLAEVLERVRAWKGTP